MCHFHFVQFFFCSVLRCVHRKGTSSVCRVKKEQARMKIYKKIYTFLIYFMPIIFCIIIVVFCTQEERTLEQKKKIVCVIYIHDLKFALFLCSFSGVSVWTAKRQIGWLFFPEYYVVCGSGIGREVWKMHASNVHIFDFFFTFHIFITTTWRL